jgi:hypothetical protein
MRFGLKEMVTPFLLTFVLLATLIFLLTRVNRLAPENPEEERAEFGIRNDKYITHVYHSGPNMYHVPPEDNGLKVAGSAHVENCLIQAVSDGVHTGRRVIWPSPRVMLDPIHNNGKTVDRESFADYYDNTLLDGILAKGSPIYHGDMPGTFHAAGKTVEVIDARNPLESDADIVVVSYFDDPDDDLMHRSACNGWLGKGILSWEERRDMGILDMFQPSAFVVGKAMDIVKKFGDFDTLHLRRGDVVHPNFKGYSYEGKTYEEMVEMTDISNVLRFIDKVRENDRPMIVFTNEQDPKYLKQLKAANVILESELGIDQGDNFMNHMIGKIIFKLGKVRISTVKDKMGPSTHYLWQTI